jgi:osmoprotectant transport system ATP-binding protein
VKKHACNQILERMNKSDTNAVPIFELMAVCKRYGDTVALNPTYLMISPSKTSVLIGPSGSGKSTLLRILVGLIVPDQGTVRFLGKPMNRRNINSLRQKMGFVVQEGGLFPHMSAEANVTLMACQHGWDDDRIQNRLTELTEHTRFPRDGLKRYPAQLSGGQRQRVSLMRALMRALMLDPEVLLLDEPLGALDPLIRFDLQNDLKVLFDTLHKTVVLVTHDIAEAGFFADSIVLMQGGRIVQQGTLAELVSQPADTFVERFINAQRAPLESLMLEDN